MRGKAGVYLGVAQPLGSHDGAQIGAQSVVEFFGASTLADDFIAKPLGGCRQLIPAALELWAVASG